MALPALDDFLKPISPEAPSGEDLRYHPISDQIKEARRREDSVSQGVWKREVKEADYKLVIKLCREALTKRGKDLQLVAWFTEALIHQEGVPGLLFGLRLIKGLLEQFWETVYPEIEDDDLEMRATPINWIGSQLDDAVKSVPITRPGLNWITYTESKTVPSEERAAEDSTQQEIRQDAVALGKITPEDFEKAFQDTPYEFYKKLNGDITEALETLQDLSGFCDEKFGDVSPNLGGLRNTLEDVEKVVRVLFIRKQEIEGVVEEAKGEAEPEPELEESAAPLVESSYDAPLSAARPAVRARTSALSAEPEDEQDALGRILAATEFLRHHYPQQLEAYLLTRALRWGQLRAAGPQPDFSLLEPPPTDVRVGLKRLFSEGQYEQALAVSEDAMAMPCGRAWLDLQRYSVRCCQILGGYYEPIERAIKDELRSFLTAYPDLPDWTLADDTPAANTETRQWLKEEGLLPDQPQAPPPVEHFFPPPNSEPEPSLRPQGEEVPPDAADLAMEAARAGRIQEAVALLWREAAQETSGRGRFVRRSQLARVCLSTGHQSIALPILQELEAEISARKLEDWENPELVAQVLAMYFRALGSSEESRDLRRSLYERLCRLDPMQALQIGDRP